MTHSMARASAPAAPRAGLVEDMERAETALHRLVRDLVADGDRRAISTGRRARRTLDEMTAGASR
ncbi:hypothetical protein ACFU5O_27920 [Streptomyces sp. NPDC057445]|uniref:hypothetical protein n=1 Tax=Streptomyces sp. NPDC057445 TaxID=3346136 RepID=UPI0036CE113A